MNRDEARQRREQVRLTNLTALAERTAALQSMVWQFAYRSRRLSDGRRILTTGGLGALEEAFLALGWADPYELPESPGCCCETCGDWATCTAGGRWWCGEHMPP